jgi:uncharacterized membrane protein
MGVFEQARSLEHEERLDRLVDAIERRIPEVLTRPGVREPLSGDFLGHPLHPILTDVPVGGWIGSTLIDVVGPQNWRGASRVLTGLGLVAALPAVASGLVELKLAQGRARRVIAVHAAANAAAMLCYSASFVAKGSSRRRAGLWCSLLGAGFLGAGGYLGGHLTYVLGLGVDPQGRGATEASEHEQDAADPTGGRAFPVIDGPAQAAAAETVADPDPVGVEDDPAVAAGDPAVGHDPAVGSDGQIRPPI